MAFKALAPGISVTTQLSPDAIDTAAAAGFRTIINNRPDGEEAGQLSSAALETRVRSKGLSYAHIPVAPGQYDEASIEAFRTALDTLPGPVLAFCKSGTRATSLWGLCIAGDLSCDAIQRQAAAAGYDLTALAPRLAARATA